MGSEASDDAPSYILPDRDRPDGTPEPPEDPLNLFRRPSEVGYSRRLRKLELDNAILQNENNVLKRKVDDLYSWKQRVEHWMADQFEVQLDQSGSSQSSEGPVMPMPIPNTVGTSSIKTEDFHPLIVDVRSTAKDTMNVPLRTANMCTNEERNFQAHTREAIMEESPLPTTSAGYALRPSASNLPAPSFSSTPIPPKKRKQDPKSDADESDPIESQSSNSSSRQEERQKNVDEERPCSVCNAVEAEENNTMIFCEKCDVCVCQACYGVKEIPSGDWYCKPCSVGLDEGLECIFCPNSGGAMVPVGPPYEDYWAHAMCTIWIPEVRYEMKDGMDVDLVVEVDKIDPRRIKMTCSLCKSKNNGVCVECCWKRCRVAFHVTCASKDPNTLMESIDDEKFPNGVSMKIYCEKHKQHSETFKKQNKC